LCFVITLTRLVSSTYDAQKRLNYIVVGQWSSTYIGIIANSVVTFCVCLLVRAVRIVAALILVLPPPGSPWALGAELSVK
jgi:hypothetical protein